MLGAPAASKGLVVTLSHQHRPKLLPPPPSLAADALDAGDNSTLAALRTQFLALDANADGQLSTAEFDAELDGYLPYGNSTDVAPVSVAGGLLIQRATAVHTQCCDPMSQTF